MQRDQDDVALQRPADRRRLSCGQMPIIPSHLYIHQYIFIFLILICRLSLIYRINTTTSLFVRLPSKSAFFRGSPSYIEYYTY